MAHDHECGTRPGLCAHRAAAAPVEQPVAPPTLPLPWMSSRRRAHVCALAARKAVPQQHTAPEARVEPDTAEQRAQKREWLLAELDIARVRRALRIPGATRYRG